MKKLRIKVFLTIFTILTIVTLFIVGTSTVKSYIERKNTIVEILTNVYKFSDMNKTDDKDIKMINGVVPGQDEKRIYLDFTIYTILLDEDGKYQDTINHTFYDEYDKKTIKNIASRIIKNHKDGFYVGNLYFNKYSYAFTQNNTLIIMDNTSINALLLEELTTNIILTCICEILIIIITQILTNWIIDPVRKSFEKQKVFVADASHELKTPLSVMIASADAYFNDKDEKWVHNMKNESERMIKLVTELLDLAKTEKEQEIVKQNNNLSEIIESSILTFEGLFYDNNIELKYDIKPDIHLYCNEDLIVELMSILVDNAIKHSEDKGKVIVNLYKSNRQIVLEVKNKGLPIKKDEEEKIFERFYKVDSSRNRNSNNYGLGLAIAKNIVEGHKGQISAHSSNGYTTFKVTWNQR